MISFINVTFGNRNYINELVLNLNSLGSDEIELIVIDQNSDFEVKELLTVQPMFPIIFLKSKENHLAKNRNVGIAKSTREIICFTDDDIRYPENFSEVLKGYFNDFKQYDFLLGSVFTMEDKRLAFVKREEEGVVQINDLFYLVTSVAIFFKRRNLRCFFDERFGIGSKFGSSEEIDFIHSNMKNGCQGYYVPVLKVFHPEIAKFQSQSVTRIKARSLGHGGYFRKNGQFLSFLNYCVFRPILKGFWLICTMRFTLGLIYFRIFYYRTLGFLTFK